MAPQLLQQYEAFLARELTPGRLAHTHGVAQVMSELAAVYALEADQALAAALLHDAAKDLAPEQVAEMMRQANIEIRCEEDRDYVYYLHGPVGAYLVSKELGVSDPLVLDAIAMHTFYGEGPNFDAPLVWCLRFADILEPGRSWHRAPELREAVSRLQDAVYAGQMEIGAWLQTGWLIGWFEATGKPVHPNMRRVYHELAARLQAEGRLPSGEESL